MRPDKTAALAALTVEPFFPPPGPLAKFVQQESAKMGTRHSDYTDRTTISARVSLSIARANPCAARGFAVQLLDLMLQTHQSPYCLHLPAYPTAVSM